MDVAKPLSTANVSPTETQSYQLSGTLLYVIRAAWVVFVGVVFLEFLVSLPRQYTLLTSNALAEGYQPIVELLNVSDTFLHLWITVIDGLTPIPFVLVAFVLFWRNSRNALALITGIVLVTLGCLLPALISFGNQTILPGLTFQFFVVAVGLFASNYFALTFPDGRFTPGWAVLLLLPSLLIIFNLTNFPIVAFLPGQATSSVFSFLTIMTPFIPTLAIQVYRYHRTSTWIQRQQTKWVMVGLTILLIVAALGYMLPVVFPILNTANMERFVFYWLLWYPLRAVLLAVFPVCVAIAVLRYRLWNISFVVNRSLVYSGVTLILLVIFLGVTLLIQTLIGGSQPLFALGLSAVGVVLLFNSVQRRVQHYVDRRIYQLNFDINQLAAAQKKPEIKNPGLYTGRMFGKYEVLGVLGHGGMGEVYKGYGEGATVAIKVLPEHLAQEAGYLKRFQREIEMLFQLHHPNIVKLLDSGVTEDGVNYLVMEFIKGVDLSDWLKRGRVTDYEIVRGWMAHIAPALDYIHELGLVHRDLKPSNIMLREVVGESLPQPVLMDFGIARMINARTRLTESGAIGTIDYMAPEQISSAREVDRRADIYALGVILYEMLTGERLFKGSVGQVMFAHLQHLAPDPRKIEPNIPTSIAEAVLKALEKDPDNRFASVGEFAMTFER